MKTVFNKALSEKIGQQVEEIFPEVVAFRREIHMHPCVGMDTAETEAFVKEKLTSWGIEILDSKVGVLGLIRGQDHDHVIALRADMDALPLEEETGLEFSSCYKGKMHACGHDFHTAMLLGSAKILNSIKDDLKNDVLLVFQPSEEGPIISGAKEMLPYLESTGMSDKIVAMFGQHVFNQADAGFVGTQYGPGSASTDVFKLTFLGKGGHCANPHANIDALSLGARFVVEMESFMSRRMDPFDHAICAIGTFHAGTANNITPETATLTASIRCHREETRQIILDHVEKIAKGICLGWDADYELEITRGLPILMNNDDLVTYVREVVENVEGIENFEIPNPMMGAEDFAYFAEKFPSAFVVIGSRNIEKGMDKENHSPHVDFDEEAIRAGLKTFCNAVVNY